MSEEKCLVEQETAAFQAIAAYVEVARPQEGDIDITAFRGEEHINRPVQALRQAIRPLIGKPLVFGTTINTAYAVDRGQSPPYKKINLPSLYPRLTPVRGVLTGLVNVRTPGEDRTPAYLRDIMPKKSIIRPRFCLRLAPLAGWADAEWRDFYLARNMPEALQHPGAVAAYAGRSVCIPLINIKLATLHVPRTADEAVHPILRS
jgi:hypothetical protein